MTAAVSFVVVMALSLLVVRVGTVALMHTGISKPIARFQARSAFTGTGFTTREAESVVDHPVRRRIVGWLMLLRNAGLIGAASSLFLSFVDAGDTDETLRRLAILVGGIGLVWLAALSQWFDRVLSRTISWALSRFTELRTYDFESLLGFEDDYRVIEIRVGSDDWMCGRSLADMDLPKEGIYVLGIHRSEGGYVGVPRSTTELREGDTIVVYGHRDRLDDLGSRRQGREGEAERKSSERAHADELAEQDAEERERGSGTQEKDRS